MGQKLNGMIRTIAIIAVAAPLLSACDSKENKANELAADSMAAARARGETDLSNPEMGAKMQVTLTEFDITQSHTEVPRGQLTIVVQNQGKMAHGLEVNGPGSHFVAPPIPAGGYILMSMILDQPGEYEIVDPDSAGAHKDRGMAAKLLVTTKPVIKPTTAQ